MQHTKITWARVKHHFAYSWWAYALLLVVTLFGWDLLYIEKIPREQKLDVYVVTPTGAVSTWSDEVRAPLLAEMPDLQEIQLIQIALGAEQDYAATMQLTTYIGARDGDAMLLSREKFGDFSSAESGGLFIPLEPYLADGTIDATGIDLTAGTGTSTQGQRALCGIPADGLYGLWRRYGIDPEGLVWAIPAYTPNQNNAAKLIGWMLRQYAEPKPEGYDAYKQSLMEQSVQMP